MATSSRSCAGINSVPRRGVGRGGEEELGVPFHTRSMVVAGLEILVFLLFLMQLLLPSRGLVRWHNSMLDDSITMETGNPLELSRARA